MYSCDQKDKKIALLLFLAVLIYFGFNCPPNVTVEDSGDFIMGLSSLGIVHGPSFPLFTMLGFLFSKIPLGEMGFRLALFSSLFGAISASLLFWLLRMWKISVTSSLIATLGLCLSSVFMGQSIIVEVYSLNLVFILLLYIFTLYSNTNPCKKNLFFMGLICASGLIHHYPLFILSCTGLPFLFKWKNLNKTNIPWALLGFLLGLTPFLYLVIQMNNPHLNYNFGKVSNWEMLWKQFLRKGYSGVDNAGGTLHDKILLSGSIIKQLFLDFKALAFVAILGIVLCLKERKLLFLKLSFITCSFLIVFLLGFKFSPQYTAVVKAYLMPATTFAAVFMAIGLEHLFKKSKSITYVSILCLFINGYTNFSNTTHWNDRFVFEWAKNGLESLEKNSVLILCGQEPYALYYTNKFLGVRPDVTIYDRLSIMTENNLYEPELLFWKVKTKKQFEQFRNSREKAFIENSSRPIYTTCLEKFERRGYKLAPTIYFNRILNKTAFKPTAKSQVLADSLLRAAIEGFPKTEYWLDSLRNMVLFNTYKFYLKNDPKRLDHFLKSLRAHKNAFDVQFIHSILELTFKNKNLKIYEKTYHWAKSNLGQKPLHHGSYGRYCTIMAQKKEYSKAKDLCLKSLKLGPPCNTTVLNNLLFISYNTKELDQAKRYALDIVKCKPEHKGANSFLNSIKN